MRTTFINTLSDMARQDDKIICVIGDTGFSVFEDFEKEFKDRFVNVGIAEQNFVGFGAGLAAMGMKPYIYNVVSFMVLRATEQIMLDVCYQENPVRLIGVGGGFAYANAGPTHHALQDIAIMSAMPGMTVFCPGDPKEMEAVMLATRDYNKPTYIRIGRSVDPVVHEKAFDFKIGKSIKMTDGDDGTIFVTGTMLKEVIAVYRSLKEKGINVGVYSLPTIKPIDEDIVLKRAVLEKPIFTVEEHSKIGGLGDTVGRVLIENGMNAKLHKLGVDDSFAPVTGSREYLLGLFGLDTISIERTILENIITI